MSTLKELKTLGGFVPSQPIKKEIKFKLDGEDEFTAIIHVKKMSIGDYEAFFIVDKEERSRTAKIISEAITLGDEGKERISFEDAYRLHPRLATAMAEAFNEVNLAKKA
jgi:tail assembly chaperone